MLISTRSHLAAARTGLRYARSWFGNDCWYLIFAITSRCNQRCRMCFNAHHEAERNSLTLDEIRRIAAGFPRLFQLTLSGGEPLLRDDLPEIVQAFCLRRPVPRITIPSNGQLPARLESLADRLCRENPDSTINIALSLDGVGEDHDAIRGVPDAFEAHLESRKRIQALMASRANLRMVVGTVFSAFNRESMPRLLEHIAENSPHLHGFMLARGEARDRNALQVADEEFLEAVEKLHALQRPHLSRLGWALSEVYHEQRARTHLQRRMADPCRAGSKLLVIDHLGELAPCEVFGPLAKAGAFRYEGATSFGNLREADYKVARLLQSQESERLRAFIANAGCHCTFECALINNFTLNPMNYLRVLVRWAQGEK